MPIAKKKGKKNVVTENITPPETIANEPVVLQLSISNTRMDELIYNENMQTILKYNPAIQEPQPYIPESSFISLNDNIDPPPISSEMEASTTNSSIMNTSVTDQSVKLQHDINCYWCCHSIIDTEYGMPIRYDVFNNTFTTYGSFCSLQCSAAYNYSINMGCDRAWEIHSWIQLIGKKYGFKGPIRPAPSRYLLKMFHGPMTIEEFRKAHTNMIQTYTLNIPPFIHIPSQVECINTSFLDNEESKNDGKLKRKPQNNQKGDLEKKMNLAFNEST